MFLIHLTSPRLARLFSPCLPGLGLAGCYVFYNSLYFFKNSQIFIVANPQNSQIISYNKNWDFLVLRKYYRPLQIAPRINPVIAILAFITTADIQHNFLKFLPRNWPDTRHYLTANSNFSDS